MCRAFVLVSPNFKLADFLMEYLACCRRVPVVCSAIVLMPVFVVWCYMVLPGGLDTYPPWVRYSSKLIMIMAATKGTKKCFFHSQVHMKSNTPQSH